MKYIHGCALYTAMYIPFCLLHQGHSSSVTFLPCHYHWSYLYPSHPNKIYVIIDSSVTNTVTDDIIHVYIIMYIYAYNTSIPQIRMYI